MNKTNTEYKTLTNDLRLKVVLDVFKNLNDSTIEYALLHNSDDLEKSLDSDFDIILSEHPLKNFLGLLRNICKQHKFKIVHILHYEIAHGYYFILSTTQTKPEFLHIDCLYDPIGINRYHLTTNQLLSSKEQKDSYFCVNHLDTSLYLLIKRSIKPGLTDTRLEKLKTSLPPETINSLHDDINNTFGNNGVKLIEKILTSQDIELASNQLKQLGRNCDNQFKRSHPIKFILQLFSSFTRKFKRLLTPSGFFVVVIGPDGCGKSTITSELKKTLNRAYRNQYHFHWRPALFPKLGKTKSETNDENTSNAPSMESKYKGPVSYARFAYYTLDFIFGYWLKLYPIKAQTTLIIGERYYADIAVHPSRYGFSASKRFVRFIGKFVPKPDLIILLSNTPETIHNRKDELPIDVIKQQLASYEDEIKQWGESIIINTDDTPSNIASSIAHIIIDRQSNKTLADY